MQNAIAGPGPFTRSRTNLFLSYRDSAVRSSSSSSYLYTTSTHGEEGKSLLADNEADLEQGLGNGRTGGETLPPKWVNLKDKVEELLERVVPKIAQLDKLHAKHVLPGFKDRSAEEREIESLANEITRDFRQTQSFIRTIAEQSKLLLRSNSNGHNPEARRIEMIMAANVQTALATKVQELSGVFRKKQTAYLKQLRGKDEPPNGVKRKGSTSHLFSSNDPLASLADDEQYSQSIQARASPIDLTQRSQEIDSIATSISDLVDLFKDLSSMVIDQGTLLDRVDYNVEQMVESVEGAVEELKVAGGYQKRSGKCQLIFLLLLLIMGCGIIIAYKPHRSSSPPPIEGPPKTPEDGFRISGSGGV